MYGFGENEKANIDKTELHYFKKLSSDLITMDTHQIEKLIAEYVLFDLEE